MPKKFFRRFILLVIFRWFKDLNAITGTYLYSKRIYSLKVLLKNQAKDLILILLGILSAGFGLKGFLLPNMFIDGGVTGVSLLVSALTGISISVLLLIINVPFIIMAFRQIDKLFAYKSIIAIIGLAICLAIIPYPIITKDKLLVSVFGGFFLGAGIGLAVRGGAVLDGTEILAIYLSRKWGTTVGDIIWMVNVFIFSAAAYLLSIETALYSILIYLAASKTVDFLLEGVEEYTGITIISIHSDEIRRMLQEKLKFGVTIYSGKRGFGKTGENLSGIDIVFTVITRLEIARVKTEIERIDPNAFVVMHPIKDTKGGIIKKRSIKDL